MQVLLALVDADGAVVTRDELLRLCWSSRFVGDDALNRAIAGVRRVVRDVAADSFVVETISRTGYRLAGPAIVEPLTPSPADEKPRVSRRAAAAGALVVGGVAIAGIAGWRIARGNEDAEVRDLAAQASLAAAMDAPEGYQRATTLLRTAVALRPRDAYLWGRLAVSWCAVSEYASRAGAAVAVQGCEAAAARALALDSRQPDARAALSLLYPRYGDWLVVERKLLAVLADAPTQAEALEALAVLYQSVGRVGEAAALSERASIREDMTPLRQYRWMYRLWTSGRVGEADRVIERAAQLWPRHPGVWFARLYLMAFTGRTGLALAQVDDLDGRPSGLSDAIAATLRLSVEAVRTREPATVAKAVRDNLAEAAKGPAGVVTAILVLNSLERVDEAFAVAEGYLLRRGAPLMPLDRARGQPVVGDQRQRKTMMLFVPPSAVMRTDPRFIELCRGCGLADYWTQSGRWPDFLKGRRIP
jgi:tetratricopeptide (TPR) repeat protein